MQDQNELFKRLIATLSSLCDAYDEEIDLGAAGSPAYGREDCFYRQRRIDVLERLKDQSVELWELYEAIEMAQPAPWDMEAAGKLQRLGALFDLPGVSMLRYDALIYPDAP